jgi:hypothetical protein
MNAFVPFLTVTPRAACLPATPRVCAARIAPLHSAFLGAPVAVARSAARPGAATVRMDVTVVVGDSEPIGGSIFSRPRDAMRPALTRAHSGRRAGGGCRRQASRTPPGPLPVLNHSTSTLHPHVDGERRCFLLWRCTDQVCSSRVSSAQSLPCAVSRRTSRAAATSSNSAAAAILKRRPRRTFASALSPWSVPHVPCGRAVRRAPGSRGRELT